MTRYARQTILPEIGDAGQARLTASHVLVVGAGALPESTFEKPIFPRVASTTIVSPEA